jgi:putative flippase GtrA
MTGQISTGELTSKGRPVGVAAALSGQFARFVAVGASNTALTLASYALLIYAGLHYLAAIVPAFLLGALNGYTLNRVWTFRAGEFQGTGLARYITTQLAALGLNALALVAFVEVLGMTRLLAQVLAMPIVSCLTFWANRRWVFVAPTSGRRFSIRPSVPRA